MAKEKILHTEPEYDIDDQRDSQGLSHAEWLAEQKQRRPEWYERNRVRIENPVIWEQYLNLE